MRLISEDEKVEQIAVLKVIDRLRQVPGAKIAIAVKQEY